MPSSEPEAPDHPDGPAVFPPDAVPALPMHVRLRRHQGRILVGGYRTVVELSDTATFVWQQIDGARTVAEIGRLLAEEYGIEVAEAVADVGELCADLAGSDLLTVTVGDRA